MQKEQMSLKNDIELIQFTFQPMANFIYFLNQNTERNQLWLIPPNIHSVI